MIQNHQMHLHQFMSYEGVNSDTYCGDYNFFSEFSIEELQELLDI